jgi:hypothetical protein|uniref:Uncharacterized protein n=1 Tax=Arabidopsis thaliana TaxID=3702 RepID=Q1G302_ARATH|nr:unknown protein [Arabidopsis thaliana]
MAREHSSFPGHSAAMLMSVITGATMNDEKQYKKIVMKRCPSPWKVVVSSIFKRAQVL